MPLLKGTPGPQVIPMLPEEKPRHVLGIADHKHLERLSSYGGDTFDSVSIDSFSLCTSAGIPMRTQGATSTTICR